MAMGSDQCCLVFGRFLRAEAAIDGLGFPLHPGAAAYYMETGLVR